MAAKRVKKSHRVSKPRCVAINPVVEVSDVPSLEFKRGDTVLLTVHATGEVVISREFSNTASNRSTMLSLARTLIGLLS